MIKKKELQTHYTASFKGVKMKFHGERLFDKTGVSDIRRRRESIIDDVKADLMDNLKGWGFRPRDLETFEIYYFDNGKEINIFSYGLQQGA